MAEDLFISADSIQKGIQRIIVHLESLNSTEFKTIYLDGWDGLGASAVLRSIAENPPSSLKRIFDRIIHIDCLRWKSRRALQRAIAVELKLPHEVMAVFDRQDEDDDFSMVDEGSRAEIVEVTRVILGSLLQSRCLVLFHNGSNVMVDLYDCGLLPPRIFGTTVLWTFRGRLRHDSRIKDKLDKLQFFINFVWLFGDITAVLWEEEAKEMSSYTHKLGLGVTPEIVKGCLLYLLTLDASQYKKIMDYNWTIHACNYWVCDGVIAGGGQENNKAWEVARALHQEIRLEDYSSNTNPNPWGDSLKTPPNRWIFIANSDININTHLGQETTSLFFATQSESEYDKPLPSLPNDMFHQAGQLRVLKLCHCSFSFLSPPFHCCHNLRFLGLDSCMDSPQGEGEERGRALEIFQRLWVLDVCRTDWELDFPQEREEQMGANIREIHIKKGRIWHNNLTWRRLRNLHKLRVIEPTCSWVTGKMDEFTDMLHLEHLDLSGNSTIQVLPSLSRATGLKNLVLDGCVGLEHVGPEGLPPSLETFCLDAGSDPKVASKLVNISLAGCVCLKDVLLRGALPDLEELNLSGTSIRKLDLNDEVVQVQGLEKVFLVGCKQLRAIRWWRTERELKVLCIDNHERNSSDLGRPPCSDSSTISIQQKNYNGYVILSDARIIQSLVIGSSWLITSSMYLHLYNIPRSTSSSRSKGQNDTNSSVTTVITKPCCYNDVLLQLQGANANAYDDITSSCPAPSDFRHVEVSEGISLTDVESNKGIEAIDFMMLRGIDSLHVHDNSRIIAIWCPDTVLRQTRYINFKCCRVERCPKLQAVFVTYDSRVTYLFSELKTIWASDLLAAGCIWCKGTICDRDYNFGALQSIHLHNCPRLKYVLPLGRYFTLLSLETLHITHCGDLRHVFPRDLDVPPQEQGTVMEFLKLKHICLYDLPSLQEICEGWSMYAPMLETVKLRGCWSLRRLPAVGREGGRHRPVVVHCEKDCWEKLEWDGPQADHHPSSLYEMRQSSSYYKKRLPRGTLLC